MIWELKEEIKRRAARDYNVSRTQFYRMEQSGLLDMSQVASRIRPGGVRREYLVASFQTRMDEIVGKSNEEERKCVPNRSKPFHPAEFAMINA